MTLQDFIISLALELRYRGLAFDRAALQVFAASVWPMAEDDPDPGRWVGEFVQAMQPAA